MRNTGLCKWCILYILLSNTSLIFFLVKPTENTSQWLELSNEICFRDIKSFRGCRRYFNKRKQPRYLSWISKGGEWKIMFSFIIHFLLVNTASQATRFKEILPTYIYIPNFFTVSKCTTIINQMKKYCKHWFTETYSPLMLIKR